LLAAAAAGKIRDRTGDRMPHETTLLTLLAGGLVLAFVMGMLAQRLKLSPLVGYLLAGVLVGPFTPGFVGNSGMAAELAEIGVILLMFGVGLHFSVDDLREVRRVAFPWAVLPIAFGTGLGWLLARAIGWGSWQGVVFGLSLSVASTVVLLRALEEHRLEETARGKTAIGWLIIEDLVMVLALVLLPVLAQAVADPAAAFDAAALLRSLGLTLGKLLLFGALMWLVGRRVVPWVLRRVAGTGSRELFTLCVLAIALGVAFASAEWFGVSIALGAFFAGMLLNESELSAKAAADSLPMRDAFAVLFFVSVGMLFDPSILLRQPLLVLATFLIITVGKPVAAWALVRLLGRSQATALTIGASVAQIGEFSFILAGLAVGMGLLPAAGRDLVLAGALMSIIANPLVFLLLVRWQAGQAAPAAAPRVAEPEPPAGPPLPEAGHIILVGYGRVGRQLCELLKARGRPLVVIDNDAELVEQAHADGIAAVRGNAANAERLAELSPATASHALVAIPQAFEAGEIIARLRAANPAMVILARAHSDPELRHLLEQGADGAVLAERELAYSMAEMVMAAP
jgi:CPA2 family monovalent cation:H+ antiporter-2